MRIAAWNIEWFNALFDDDGRLQPDDRWSARHGVTRREQISGLVEVFRALDADAVLVVEAPDDSRRRSTVRALEAFADHAGIRARRALIGFANATEQEIALLHDPGALTAAHDPQESAEAPRFDRTFRIALPDESAPEAVAFGKPPLELRCRTAGGRIFRLVGVHVKSKAPRRARTPAEGARSARESRRTQIAQCLWLRARVEAHLRAGDSLIVLGDFNDGPGFDEVERSIGRSSVEIVMGEGCPDAALCLHDPHAAGRRHPGRAAPSTARFYIEPEERWLSALLDYVMVSPDLMHARPRWRIWHPFDDRACWRDPVLRRALLHASDHFPVSLDLDL